MTDTSRRAFITGTGLIASATAVAALAGAEPAGAVTPIEDQIDDAGGEVYNFLYYRDTAPDDTTALVNAVAAAGPHGIVYVPAGTYQLTSQVVLSGGGLIGGGGKQQNANAANTIFQCANAGAGLLVTGSGWYQDFMVDGNSIATTPMQNGTVTSGVALGDCVGATFHSVWVANSVDVGWYIVGAQDCSYIDIRTRLNHYGMRIAGGAGGLHFWHIMETDNKKVTVGGVTTGGWGVVSDGTATNPTTAVLGGTGTYVDHTEDVHFHSGIFDNNASNYPGFGKVNLTAASNWSFRDVVFAGNVSLTDAIISLDQTYGYGIDFTGSYIFHGNSANTNEPTIRITGTPSSTDARAFLIVDQATFWTGKYAVHLDGDPKNNYFTARALGANLPAVDGTGVTTDVSSLMRGRTGDWDDPGLQAGWAGTLAVRVNTDGQVQFKGTAQYQHASADGSAFHLPPGMHPQQTVVLTAYTNAPAHPVVTISITSAGVGTISSGLASLQTASLDGTSFPTR